MSGHVCRSGRHVDAPRGRKKTGGTFCTWCEREQRQIRMRLAPCGRDGWADPAADAEARQRFEAWSAGLDTAIRVIRLTEGFDGRYQEWQTLGECLMTETRRGHQRRLAR